MNHSAYLGSSVQGERQSNLVHIFVETGAVETSAEGKFDARAEDLGVAQAQATSIVHFRLALDYLDRKKLWTKGH